MRHLLVTFYMVVAFIATSLIDAQIFVVPFLIYFGDKEKTTLLCQKRGSQKE